jgi:hypothetical protein
MALDTKMAAPCGMCCGECVHYKKKCGGCANMGKPHWGECRVNTCVRERNVEHCGLCQEFPCDIYLSQYDPAQGIWRVFYRAGQLVYRKKIGTQAWLEEKLSGKNPDPKHQKKNT